MSDASSTTPGVETSTEDERPSRVIIVGPDGQPLDEVRAPTDSEESQVSVVDLVEQPAKVMRIGSMIKQLLEEVKSAPLDEASRVRLKEIHARSIKELESGLAPELIDELERLSLPFSDEGTPSEAELRIAQAALVGWLEGLFHGIQTALFAQQMAAQAQFEEMRRRALPSGPSGGATDGRAGRDGDERGSSGPYL